ncbi:hypothetical protein Nepgr_025007 [Nepenthes gracilis]|uniref:Protein YIP n=1 Tax=Nepenthes gracilis TaxID=150966 RepID=A0AAD3T646_NEPGR|nr:hypothetical protein Nepgr_025007 [Nepenthes gracilis]
MPKEFTVPPVVFPSGATASTETTRGGGPATTNLQHRRVPTAPFQPPRPSSIPFMTFDIGSASASTSTFSNPSYPPPRHDAVSLSFLDEPPLLEELEISPTLIWRKTRSLLNPFRINSSLHEDPDLSGPFLYYMALGIFQLLAGKVQFGVILGWIALSSIFLYSVLNFLAGKNGNLDLYRCFSVVGYCLMPIVVFSAVRLFFPVTGAAGFAVAAVFVIWATRICSRLLVENAFGVSEYLGLTAYPCFLIYTLFSLLVMF